MSAGLGVNMIIDHYVWDGLYVESQAVAVSEQSLAASQVNHDLLHAAFVDTALAPWVASPAKGVLRLLLDRDGGEQTTRATSIVSYQPNSRFAPHVHPRGEEFLVLSGMFSDEFGDYPAGTYVRNPPGSSHQPFSDSGCLIFVKLQQFAVGDHQHIVKTLSLNGDAVSGEWCQQLLFDDYERVMFLQANKHEAALSAVFATLSHSSQPMVLEILIISGSLAKESQRYNAGCWLRFPIAHKQALLEVTSVLRADKQTQLFVKCACVPEGFASTRFDSSHEK